jgi:hypothetical protein
MTTATMAPSKVVAPRWSRFRRWLSIRRPSASGTATHRASSGVRRDGDKAWPAIPTGGFRPPVSRHRLSSVKPNTVVKKVNTVIAPWVDVATDVRAINAGEAFRSRGTFTVNGRVYGVHNGSIHPISGDGLMQLDALGCKGLGIFNTRRRYRASTQAPRADRKESVGGGSKMIWFDVLLGTNPPREHLRRALARAFTTAPDEVLIVDDMDDLKRPYGVAAILFTDTGPQFPLHLSMLAPGMDGESAVPDTAKRLAAELDERVLAPSDDTPNPYIFTLFLPTGEIQHVSVDTVALDEREEYLIDGPADPQVFET